VHASSLGLPEEEFQREISAKAFQFFILHLLFAALSLDQLIITRLGHFTPKLSPSVTNTPCDFTIPRITLRV
jgi:hypothetical protein